MKPRVGISRCLLGDEVRYDATHKRSDSVMALGPYVEWVSVCPEVEVGMGVPREPIQLVARADGTRAAGEHVRLLGVLSGDDWTERMERWAQRRVAELARLDLSGFVLKARSPSCGPDQVLVHQADGGTIATGRGLFAEALMSAMPALPVEDEETLSEPAIRDAFLERVRAYSP